jgi:TfoX/Sxy family transcriptional regulator of competence genes
VAYSEELGDRISDVLAPRGDAISERKMFGGLAFMVNGNMACGLMSNGGLMVRLAAEDADRALGEPHVREMDFTGRKMKGFVIIEPAGFEADEDLASWVEAGADYAASLPPKKPKG